MNQTDPVRDALTFFVISVAGLVALSFIAATGFNKAR